MSEILLIPTGCRQLGTLRAEIITRLGIGTVPTIKTDTLANIQADLFNMLGMAAMAVNPPPGIASMITSFINEAQQMIFNAIEMDQGANTKPPVLVNGSDVTVFDRTAVTTLALGLGKAHYGQEDAQIYMQESAKYLKDYADRSPVNIKNIVNAHIIDAHRVLFSQYFTMASAGASTAFPYQPQSGTFTLMNPFLNDDDCTTIAGEPVFLLALANLKAYYKQPDAQMAMDEFKLYMADMPANAWNLVGQMVTMAQEKLFRQYSVFRGERWWTWTLNKGQTFYNVANDDDAAIPTPTGVTATVGATSAPVVLPVGNALPTVTAMADGRVLIAGGLTSAPVQTANAYIYDPVAGTLTVTGSLNYPRFGHRAVLLNDGRVLITGGQGLSARVSAEIYDPTIGAFSVVGQTLQPHFNHQMIVLKNGKVLIAGGAFGNPGAEIFDPNGNTFTFAGNMQISARDFGVSALLPDGNVLIGGGFAAGGPVVTTNTTEIYMVATNTFVAGPNLSSTRYGAVASVLPTGNVLIAGGTTDGSQTTYLASADLYTPAFNAAGTIAATGSMTNARVLCSAFTLQSGKVLVAGGLTTAGATTATAELFSEATGTFTTTGSMLQGVQQYGASLLHDGTVAYFGGWSGSTYYSNAQIFYPTTGAFAIPANQTQGTDYYRVAAFDNQGHYTLPSVEISVAAVPANTAVKLAWTPSSSGSVAGYAIFGRATGAEQLLETVDKYTTTWTDLGTLVPNGAMPTVNTTGTTDVGQTHPILDQRKVSWAGVSRGDNMWRPLIKGVPPVQYRVPLAGVPAYYDIREAIEIWPPPADSSWLLRIKGEYQLAPFVAPTDTATIDYQAIYLQATADVKAFYKQPDAEHFMLSTREYVGNLVAGQHTTQRYIPTQHSDYIAPTIPVALPPVT